MPIDANLRTSYELVLKDLETKRDLEQHAVIAHQKRLRDYNQQIAGLYREVGVPIPAGTSIPSGEAAKGLTIQMPTPPAQRYALISVHWAILHILSEAKLPMTTAEIADALTKGGVKTRAANFTNNVSAVLSTNMRPRGEEEVEVIDGRWSLTETGRNKIAFIVSSSKFRRVCPWIADSVGAA